jgi:DNA-binding MurR/RpiR family transcriptional regulator
MPVFSYEQLRKMNPGEFRVYNFIVSHFDAVPEMNIRQIAESAGVSTTTVLRFCEKAGCSGYTELKYRIRQEFDMPNRNGSFDADPAMQYMKITAKDSQFADKMAQAAKICADACQIILSGNRESKPLIRYGAYLFSGVGKAAFTAEEGWGSACPEGKAKPAVLILSSQGSGEEMISLINRYKKSGAPLISVTNTEHCPIARMSDVNFSCYMPEISRISRYGRTELVSQIPLVYLLETLASEIPGFQKQEY